MIRREILAKSEATAWDWSNYFPIKAWSLIIATAEIKTELLSPRRSFNLIGEMRATSAAKGTQQETASPLTFHTPSSPLADWISQLIPATDYWYTLLPVEAPLMTHQLASHLSFLMSTIHSIWAPYRWIIHCHTGGMFTFDKTYFDHLDSYLWLRQQT